MTPLSPPLRKLIAPLLAVSALAACADKDAVLFVTGTDLALKFDAAAQSASIGFDRVEGVRAPVFEGAEIPPVYGAFETDRSIFTPELKQVHATGKAVLIASGKTDFKGKGSEKDKTELIKAETGTKRMFFGTNTGVNLGFTLSSARPAHFNLGFKRQELSYIPLTNSVKNQTNAAGAILLDRHTNKPKPALNKDGVPKVDSESWSYAPVIGAITLSTKLEGLETSGLGLEQFFATGDASQPVAGYGDITKSIRDKIRDEEKQQKQANLPANQGPPVHPVPVLPVTPAPVPPKK